MIGDTVQILRATGHNCLVTYRGETWQAESEKAYKKGERAEINGIKGLTLQIRKLSGKTIN